MEYRPGLHRSSESANECNGLCLDREKISVDRRLSEAKFADDPNREIYEVSVVDGTKEEVGSMSAPESATREGRKLLDGLLYFWPGPLKFLNNR